MALAVPAGRTATVAGMAAGLAGHTEASAGMVAALAVRPGYTVPVADMAAVPADHTAASAGMVAALAVHPGYTVPVADMTAALAVHTAADMAAELTALPDHSVPDFAQPSQLFPAPHSAQKSTRHQLRQYLLLYSVHPCCHLPPM